MSITQTLLASIFKRKPQSQFDRAGFQDFNKTEPAITDTYSATEPERKLFGAQPTKKPSARPSKQTGTKRKYQLVGTLDELRQLTIDPPHPKTAVILTGELVLLCETVEKTPENYSRQTDRLAKSIGFFPKQPTPFTLKVWLHRNVLDAQKNLKHTRFYFAIDQYLNLGKSSKDSRHLIAGSSGNNETIIHIFTFESGNLTAIDEKVLQSSQHPRFNADFAELLNTLKRDQLPITIITPLPNQDNDQITYIGDEIYSAPIQYFITNENAAPKFLSAHGIPIAVVGAAVFAFIAAMAFPYNKYNLAITQFQKVASTIPKTGLTFGSSELNVMKERRIFLTEGRAQEQTIKFLRDITYALSTEGVIIKNIKLDQKKQKPEDPDISVTIQERISKSEAPIDQIRPILDRLSGKLGITLHLANSGYQTQKSATGDTITYSIEGNFKGK